MRSKLFSLLFALAFSFALADQSFVISNAKKRSDRLSDTTNMVKPTGSSPTSALAPTSAASAFEFNVVNLPQQSEDFIVGYLNKKFEEWIAGVSDQNCLAVLKHEKVLRQFGLKVMVVALAQNHRSLIDHLLNRVVMSMTTTLRSIRKEMFKAVLDYTLTNPRAQFLNPGSPLFIRSVIELFKSSADCEKYSIIVQGLLTSATSSVILKLWTQAAIDSMSFSVSCAFMKILPREYSKDIAYFVLKNHETFVEGPSVIPMHRLKMLYPQIGLEYILAAAFECNDVGFLNMVMSGGLTISFELRHLRKLLNVLSMRDCDRENLIAGFKIIYRSPKLIYESEIFQEINFESSLLREVIVADDLELLRVLTGYRYQCEACCIQGPQACKYSLFFRKEDKERGKNVVHFLLESELRKAYILAIQSESKECLRGFLSGIYEWIVKVEGHRFMPLAFKMGKYDFAVEMMKVYKIPINLTDTPALNPRGDLLLYATEHAETFNWLVENGAYLNVYLEFNGEIISLLSYLQVSGKQDLAKILLENGARQSPEIASKQDLVE